MPQEFEWNLDEIVDQLDEAIAEGLHDGGELWLRESNELSPDDTGEMDASGQVAVDGNEALIGYASPYAWKQHEKLHYRHTGGGQPKFLEESGYANAEQIFDAVGQPIRRVLGG